jgi:hypothetical protein
MGVTNSQEMAKNVLYATFMGTENSSEKMDGKVALDALQKQLGHTMYCIGQDRSHGRSHSLL